MYMTVLYAIAVCLHCMSTLYVHNIYNKRPALLSFQYTTQYPNMKYCTESIRMALQKVNVIYKTGYILKPQQIVIIMDVFNRGNDLEISPTGFGKRFA